MVGAIGTISRTHSTGAQRARPAMLKTSMRRISAGAADSAVPPTTAEAKSPAESIGLSSGSEPLIMEAERSERILGMRDGFAHSDRSERFSQIIR